MRAAIRTGLLGATITFTKHHPTPPFLTQPSTASTASLQPNEVLLKVKSAAINPVDYKLPRFILGEIVGIDVSGIVEQIGTNVTGLEVGDEVFGRSNNRQSEFTGSLAEWTVASFDEITKKPEWMTFDEAAALPTAYLTSLQALRDAGRVKEGSKVLVIGASGGCGLAGVQLSKAMGASRVVGICSGKNFDFVREVGGISELIDYTDDDAMQKFIADNECTFDCIYDTATGSGKGEDYVSSPISKVLKEKGEYVQINGGVSDWIRLFAKKQLPQRTLIKTARNSKADLDVVASLLKSTGAKPYIEVQAFDEKGVEDAFRRLSERRTRGKIFFNVA